ncbi:SAM-dependent methyltransferase [Paenibacillus sp. Soil766]|uniref:class I SAM-dependent methyltransferase n=1 Tax=Paenibacillus sp. Soil766 TaxID=1736404 RepID=UPI0007111EF5|nr:class I SAM-dependent methyltransferase [Paenibacillus sp. Soil766]KRF05548.1 SAM-dependent methyltransferase [Paenibacillus sp. Soil766]
MLNTKSDLLSHNQKAWNQQVEKGSHWTLPVSSEAIMEARQGRWGIHLTPTKKVPLEWFPPLKGTRVLCLASGGGQQAPVLAAAGANVVVVDLSDKQLEQDQFVAERDNLMIETVQGDMSDLSIFPDGSFELIVHPVSNMYVSDLQPIWHECYRVLKRGGILIAGFTNPLVYIFDSESEYEGKLEVKYSIPFSDLTSLSPELLKQYMDNGDPVIFGHSLEDQLQGQLQSGFVISGLYEDNYGGRRLLDQYISSFVATRAIKL